MDWCNIQLCGVAVFESEDNFARLLLVTATLHGVAAASPATYRHPRPTIDFIGSSHTRSYWRLV